MTYEVLNLWLNVAALAAAVLLSAIVIYFLVRLLRISHDVAGLVSDVAAYATVIEDDARRTRHAVRNLASALRMETAVQNLFDGDGDSETREEVREWLLQRETTRR